MVVLLLIGCGGTLNYISHQFDNISIEWFGDSSILIDSGVKIYYNPSNIAYGKADIVIIDDMNYCNSSLFSNIVQSNTAVIVNSDCATKISGNLRISKVGDKGIIDNVYYEIKENGIYVGVNGQSVIFGNGDADIRIDSLKNIHDVNITTIPINWDYSQIKDAKKLADNNKVILLADV